jgi:methyl acetate hydrolase
MDQLQHVIDRAVDDGDLPYVVGAVVSRDGTVWAGSAGQARPDQPAGFDAPFRLWSMTKSVGSVAILRLVDTGALKLDESVLELLPELAEASVIEEVGPTRASLRPATAPITLRHLLTHTSGLAYPLFSNLMMRYALATGMPLVSEGTIDDLRYPLAFDPGTDFAYGVGVDWAGLAIERATGRSVEEFCRSEVLEPLGLDGMTFRRDDVADRLVDVFARSGDGGFQPAEFDPPHEPELHGLGNCLFGRPADFARFLTFILRGGELDGARLLSPGTFSLLIHDLVPTLAAGPLRSQIPDFSQDIDLYGRGDRMGHSAGFLVTREDMPGLRSSGSLWWAGFLNTHYWIDPTAGTAGLLMTQLLPFGDARMMSVLERFERAAYASVASCR